MKVVIRFRMASSLFRELPESLREEPTDASRPWQVVHVPHGPRELHSFPAAQGIALSHAARIFAIPHFRLRHIRPAVNIGPRRVRFDFPIDFVQQSISAPPSTLSSL
jgi:hypothetical protein